jgi:hypothetical protein
LINACTEIGCGGLGVVVALGVGVVLGGAVAEGACAEADAAADVADEACGLGAVAGPPALHAANTRAAGSTHSAFTEPVFPDVSERARDRCRAWSSASVIYPADMVKIPAAALLRGYGATTALSLDE